MKFLASVRYLLLSENTDYALSLKALVAYTKAALFASCRCLKFNLPSMLIFNSLILFLYIYIYFSCDSSLKMGNSFTKECFEFLVMLF